MPYKLHCPKCDKEYFYDSETRFCKTCGTFLTKIKYETETQISNTLDEEKFKIAEYVVKKYESTYLNNDLELELLKNINVNDASGRFEIVFLATLFSSWAMREERAYSIWKNCIKGFRESNTTLYSFLINSTNEQLNSLYTKYGVPPRAATNIAETASNLYRHNGDIDDLKNEKDWYYTLNVLRLLCKGVDQKAFWIARIMRQKNAWNIPGQFCCVSDSHNKAFLLKTGFIDSTEDLYQNSAIMWKYFNEPFENKYYDLPIFRFARDAECKKCNKKTCNLKEMKQCTELSTFFSEFFKRDD